MTVLTTSVTNNLDSIYIMLTTSNVLLEYCHLHCNEHCCYCLCVQQHMMMLVSYNLQITT